MTRVAAYVLRGNSLAERAVPLMVQGAQTFADCVDTYTDRDFVPDHVNRYDAAVFWGYVTTCQNIMAGYRDAGKAAVYLDLPYWKRPDHCKVSVNSRHPTAYFSKYKHDSVRRENFVGYIAPYRKGSSILIAGMGSKAAWAEKLEPVNSWETRAVEEIKKHTDRPIIFRPKPSSSVIKPIPGTIFSPPEEVLGIPLAKANIIVTHHSNVGVDGLIDGVPVYSEQGVASVMGIKDLSSIESPFYPANREQWLNDVSYCQWSHKEMRSGACWNHLKAEGLIK